MLYKGKLLSITPDYMKLLKHAAGMCYQQEATDKTIEHIIAAGHLSVLEHCSASFEVTCSIQTLLQLTRHRHLSFTVQSSRGSKLTSCCQCGDADIDRFNGQLLHAYEMCIEHGVANEVAAYMLPKAAEYKLVVTGNFRAWFEYLPKRLCARAQEEHRELALEIQRELAAAAPEVFNRDLNNCKNCTESRCAFHG